MEGETAILVRVEETHQAVRLALRRGEVALISQEVEHFEGADVSVAVSVKSLEGRVRGEIADRAEALAGGLKASLSVADGNEQLFESTLRFESKGHVVTATGRGRGELGNSWAKSAQSAHGPGQLTNLFAKLN